MRRRVLLARLVFCTSLSLPTVYAFLAAERIIGVRSPYAEAIVLLAAAGLVSACAF